MEMSNKFEEYDCNGNGYTPSMKVWGKDHFSTFAYLETRAVDYGGLVDNKHMRCNPRIHRELANVSPGGVIDGGEYPTRLKDSELKNHDDWSCVEDMVINGLVKIFARRKNDKQFDNTQIKVEFLERGSDLAADLREHKQDGGSFSNFKIAKYFIV